MCVGRGGGGRGGYCTAICGRAMGIFWNYPLTIFLYFDDQSYLLIHCYSIFQVDRRKQYELCHRIFFLNLRMCHCIHTNRKLVYFSFMLLISILLTQIIHAPIKYTCYVPADISLRIKKITMAEMPTLSPVEVKVLHSYYFF